MVQKVKYAGAMCFRREEVCGEAQRVLRAFPTKSSEKEGPKPMPSFPDMVAYVQEKVRPYIFLIFFRAVYTVNPVKT